MNYSQLITCDTANGEGVRTSLFVSGCTNHCPGCFNQEAQDFNYGKLYTQDTENILLDCIKQPYISGLSILGGDPLCQDDMGLITLDFLAHKVHSLGKTVWLWTGFKWEDFNFTNNFSLQSLLLSACDVVVDGPFIEAEKDLSLAFRGSRNQRIIDVRKTLGKGEIILYKE
mgnify:FL=1